jgi:anti-sigma factor RsiW
MADELKNTRHSHPSDPVVNERVQELTWALVDEQISDDEFRLLDNLLLSDEEARHTYIGCVQLHAELVQHFQQPAEQKPTRTGKSLVLGFLNESVPDVGLPSPPSGDVRS